MPTDAGLRLRRDYYQELYAVPSLAVLLEAEWTSTMPGSC